MYHENWMRSAMADHRGWKQRKRIGDVRTYYYPSPTSTSSTYADYGIYVTIYSDVIHCGRYKKNVNEKFDRKHIFTTNPYNKKQLTGAGVTIVEQRDHAICVMGLTFLENREKIPYDSR